MQVGLVFVLMNAGRGMCCDGNCMCGESPASNVYHGEPGGVDNCQCEPLEEVCMDPEVGMLCIYIYVRSCDTQSLETLNKEESMVLRAQAFILLTKT